MASNTTIIKQCKLQILLNEARTESDLVLTGENLSWVWQTEPDDGKVKSETGAGNGRERTSVEVRIPWILKVKVEDISGSAVDPESDHTKVGSLTIHYIVRVPKEQCTTDLTHTLVSFEGPPDVCTDLAKAIEELIAQKVPSRPRSLLVIINPKSGNNKGEKVYRQKVAPIFELCGIKTDVIVSKKPKHAYEILDEYDLTDTDGLIAVGGDGTLTEVVSALLKRSMKDAGVDENDPTANQVTPDVTCSLIAAGSANGHPLYSGFSKDPTSSALVIAIGQTQTQDVVTIHCGHTFIAHALLLIGYGQTARVFQSVENNRWAGPARYLAAPFGLFFNRELIDVEMDYISADHSSREGQTEQTGMAGNPAQSESDPADQTSAASPEGAVAISETAETTEANTGSEWKTVSARVLDTGSVFIDVRSPFYGKPYCVQQNLNDGVIYMMITRNCGRMKQIKFFSKLKKFDPTAFDVDFIDYIRVKAYRVRATGSYKDTKVACVLVWDGDLVSIPEPHFETRNHQGLLKIFARHDGEELRAADADINPGKTDEQA